MLPWLTRRGPCDDSKKKIDPAVAWILFTLAIALGFVLYYAWLTIERIIVHPESLIALAVGVIFAFDVWTGRPMPFLAIDRELGRTSSSLAAALREVFIPLLVLSVLDWGVYRIFWVGDLRGLITLGAVWLADLVIAWSVRNHRWWLAQRRSRRILPSPPVMLDTDTTDPEGTR
jgi:hypothetical protein